MTWTCTNHSDREALVLITNLSNGDVNAMCVPECLAQWAVATAATFTDETPETEEAQAEAPPEVPGPDVIADMLLVVGVDVPQMTVASWSEADKVAALTWASAVHLSASDNDDVVIPHRPAFLPPLYPETLAGDDENGGYGATGPQDALTG